MDFDDESKGDSSDEEIVHVARVQGDTGQRSNGVGRGYDSSASRPPSVPQINARPIRPLSFRSRATSSRPASSSSSPFSSLPQRSVHVSPPRPPSTGDDEMAPSAEAQLFRITPHMYKPPSPSIDGDSRMTSSPPSPSVSFSPPSAASFAERGSHTQDVVRVKREDVEHEQQASTPDIPSSSSPSLSSASSRPASSRLAQPALSQPSASQRGSSYFPDDDQDFFSMPSPLPPSASSARRPKKAIKSSSNNSTARPRTSSSSHRPGASAAASPRPSSSPSPFSSSVPSSPSPSRVTPSSSAASASDQLPRVKLEPLSKRLSGLDLPDTSSSMSSASPSAKPTRGTPNTLSTHKTPSKAPRRSSFPTPPPPPFPSQHRSPKPSTHPSPSPATPRAVNSSQPFSSSSSSSSSPAPSPSIRDRIEAELHAYNNLNTTHATHTTHSTPRSSHPVSSLSHSSSAFSTSSMRPALSNHDFPPLEPPSPLPPRPSLQPSFAQVKVKQEPSLPSEHIDEVEPADFDVPLTPSQATLKTAEPQFVASNRSWKKDLDEIGERFGSPIASSKSGVHRGLADSAEQAARKRRRHKLPGDLSSRLSRLVSRQHANANIFYHNSCRPSFSILPSSGSSVASSPSASSTPLQPRSLLSVSGDLESVGGSVSTSSSSADRHKTVLLRIVRERRSSSLYSALAVLCSSYPFPREVARSSELVDVGVAAADASRDGAGDGDGDGVASAVPLASLCQLLLSPGVNHVDALHEGCYVRLHWPWDELTMPVQLLPRHSQHSQHPPQHPLPQLAQPAQVPLLTLLNAMCLSIVERERGETEEQMEAAREQARRRDEVGPPLSSPLSLSSRAVSSSSAPPDFLPDSMDHDGYRLCTGDEHKHDYGERVAKASEASPQAASAERQGTSGEAQEATTSAGSADVGCLPLDRALSAISDDAVLFAKLLDTRINGCPVVRPDQQQMHLARFPCPTLFLRTRSGWLFELELDRARFSEFSHLFIEQHQRPWLRLSGLSVKRKARYRGSQASGVESLVSYFGAHKQSWLPVLCASDSSSISRVPPVRSGANDSNGGDGEDNDIGHATWPAAPAASATFSIPFACIQGFIWQPTPLRQILSWVPGQSGPSSSRQAAQTGPTGQAGTSLRADVMCEIIDVQFIQSHLHGSLCRCVVSDSSLRDFGIPTAIINFTVPDHLCLLRCFFQALSASAPRSFSSRSHQSPLRHTIILRGLLIRGAADTQSAQAGQAGQALEQTALELVADRFTDIVSVAQPPAPPSSPPLSPPPLSPQAQPQAVSIVQQLDEASGRAFAMLQFAAPQGFSASSFDPSCVPFQEEYLSRASMRMLGHSLLRLQGVVQDVFLGDSDYGDVLCCAVCVWCGGRVIAPGEAGQRTAFCPRCGYAMPEFSFAYRLGVSITTNGVVFYVQLDQVTLSRLFSPAADMLLQKQTDPHELQRILSGTALSLICVPCSSDNLLAPSSFSSSSASKLWYRAVSLDVFH